MAAAAAADDDEDAKPRTPEEEAQAREQALAWRARLLAPLSAGSFAGEGTAGAARLAWLTGRIVSFEKGPLMSAIAAYTFCEACLDAVAGPRQLLLPSCIRGNRITNAAVKMRLESPHAALERADRDSALEALEKAAKEAAKDPDSPEAKIIAGKYVAALRAIVIPEVAAEGRFLVTALSGYGEKNKAGREDKDDKLALLHKEGLLAGTEAGLREAFYTLNQLLVDVVGLEYPATAATDKEEGAIFAPLDVRIPPTATCWVQAHRTPDFQLLWKSGVETSVGNQA